jgi:hypothetical protein
MASQPVVFLIIDRQIWEKLSKNIRKIKFRNKILRSKNTKF